MEYVDDVSFSKIDGGVVLILNSIRDGQGSTLFNDTQVASVMSVKK